MSTAFLSVCGQPGNLGDILIRKNCVHWLAQHHDRVVGYAGSMSDDFLEALDIGRLPVEFIRSPGQFLGLLGANLVRRRATFVMAPSPFLASRHVRVAVKHWLVASLAAAARIRGNRVIVVGRAVRGRAFFPLAAERLLAKVSTTYLTRDCITKNLLDVNRVSFAPDVALLETPTNIGDGERGTVAISLRFQRKVDRPGFGRLVRKIKDLGLEPVLVTQVRMDRHQHADLADEFGIMHDDWPTERPETEQLKLVKESYGRAKVVVSDRLHGLLLGLIAGASPVIADYPGDCKLGPTLDPICAPLRVAMNGDFSTLEDALTIPEQRRMGEAITDSRRFLIRQLAWDDRPSPVGADAGC